MRPRRHVLRSASRPTRFSRLVLRLALLLIAGAVTTSAVGLIGTLASRWSIGKELEAPGGVTRWQNPFWSGTQAPEYTPRRQVIPTTTPEAMRDRVRATQFEARTTRGGSLVGYTRLWRLYEMGWPCRAFWGWYVLDRSTQPRERTHGILEVVLPKFRSRFNANYEIPYLPLWRGLILNTLFYAVIWCALLALPRVIRRTRRARKGLCRSCGYDMRGLINTPCPECGHTFRA